MNLLCSLCLYLSKDGGAGQAVTVINGQAVCVDHVGYVQGGEHALALSTARDAERAAAG